MYDVRKNCGKPVYVLGVTESCGICMQKLGVWSQPGNVLDQLKAGGADVVLISAIGTEMGKFVNGSNATAEGLRTRFALGNRFFLGYDTQGSNFTSFIGQRTNIGGARIAIAMKPGNVIGAVGQIDDPAAIKAGLGIQ
jgi:hypothetical protein